MAACNIFKTPFIIFLLLLIFENIQGEECECGIANDDGLYRRIVGGVASSPHRYPWLVALKLGTKLLCGGTLVTDMHVLTAGHCINLQLLSDGIKAITVTIGAYDLRASDNVEVRILKGVKHPQYKARDQSDVNDIAILTLASKITFNNFVRPICLPKTDMNFNGVDLTVAGWGKTHTKAPKMSRLLRETNVHIVSPNFCKNSFDYKFDPSSMICAYEREMDACQLSVAGAIRGHGTDLKIHQGVWAGIRQEMSDVVIHGDSGGPLFGTRSNGKYYQVGIISWGSDCGDPRYPGVYTDVKKYLSWIRSVTSGGKWCA